MADVASTKKKTKIKKKKKQKKQTIISPKKEKKLKKHPTLCTKDLMKLGKQELIKKCKKSNLSSNGSKQEMVARILNQIKMNKENNIWLKRLNGMSSLQATTLIINGYVHTQSNFQYNMYYDIVSLIAQFVNLILVRFDLIHKKYKDVVMNSGSLIQRNCINYVKQRQIHSSSFIIGCSMGYSIGTHKWKIKIINGKGSDWIGITNNNKLCKKGHVNIFDRKVKNVSYMLMGGRYVKSVNCPREKQRYDDNNHGHGYNYWWGYNYVYKPIKDYSISGLSGWKKGDTVGFTLDCHKWKFKVYLNDEKLKTINIKQNTIYYAVIGSVNNNSQYQILSFD